MAAGLKSVSNTFMWIIMGLLIVGLAGFGVLNMSGTVRTVGTVGNQTISVDDYGRELQRQIRAFEAQTGQPLPIGQARALGIEQSVLSQLVALASLDSEVVDLGLSVGDTTVQREIVAIPAFQGIDGAFDREAYRFQLEQINIDESEFESDLRAEAARTIVQGAIIEGVVMPGVLSDAITDFVAARRSFTYLRLDETTLSNPVAEPTESQLQSYYDQNGDEFTLPETKQLTYVTMTPTMLLDQVNVDESELQNLYDERADRYNIPERRLVERLVFADAAAASDAMAQIEVNGATFESLVADMGLNLADTDLGDLSKDDLDEAGDEVFAGAVGEVIGPLPSALGPALYRINGTLSGQTTSFADIREQLHEELAAERARRLIDVQAENIDDLLAGGATLQELADETDMELGQTSWSALSFEGVAAYSAFREAAQAVVDGDFPEVGFLADGGIFALQLDEVLPPRPEPFADARDQVIAAWTLGETEAALRQQADAIINDITRNGDFASTGSEPRVETALTRTAFLEDTTANFMNEVFEMETDELRVINGTGVVFVVRLDEELPPEDTAELRALRERLGEEANQSLALALFEAFVGDAQVRARPDVDQRAMNAIQAGGGGGGFDGHVDHTH